MPLTASAVIGAASEVGGIVEGVAQAFGGSKAKRKKEEELSKLKRPFYKIQDEYYQNKNLTGINAETGLPTATKDYYTTEAQRGLGAGINAIEVAGGDPNNISKLYDTYERGISKVASEDADAHVKNLQYFMTANKDLAGQKNIAFGVNELQPYEQKVKQLTEDIKAEEQNKWNGINTALGSLSGLGNDIPGLGGLGKGKKGGGASGGDSGGSNRSIHEKLFGNASPNNPPGAINLSDEEGSLEDLTPQQREQLSFWLQTGGKY